MCSGWVCVDAGDTSAIRWARHTTGDPILPPRPIADRSCARLSFLFCYLCCIQAELEAAEAADAAADEEPEAPVEQEENEDRPHSGDADADSLQQQPLPLEKKEPGKYIPSKVNQQDL